MGLVEEAEHQSTDEGFYWAVGQLAKGVGAIEDELDALNFAIQWCVDYKVSIGFHTLYVNILLPAPYHHLVWGPTFLDAVEQGRLWIEGFEHDSSRT